MIPEPTSQNIVTTSGGGKSMVFDIANGQRPCPPLRHAGNVLSAELSPDSRKVVMALRSGTALRATPEDPEALAASIAVCELRGASEQDLGETYARFAAARRRAMRRCAI